MPGTLGDLYESMVGPTLVERIGKPYHHVYDLALQQHQDSSTPSSSSLNHPSCLMIGDALETDVMGGTWIGCDTLWVINNGIHAPQILQDNRCTENNKDDDDAPYNESAVHSCLEDFNARQTLTPTPLRPTHVMPYFKW
jgi:ribonucleotide monophosphatase NagD (HAD superfamily)